MIARLSRSPVTWVAVVLLAAGAAFGLYWFQPWKLVTDTEVAEPLSAVDTTTPPPAGPPPAGSPSAGPSPAGSPSAAPATPTLVRQGSFVTHEHATSGTARIVRLPDGTHRLELVDLDTSNGPDLRVWLTDQPVKTGVAGWRVFDDGRWVELGRLKGNRGDQSYLIPPDVDLTDLTSVSVWCKRFSVSFGAAPLDAVG
ncbi:DM13 domain-containing protein [Micromonospora sp. WMMD882]|uniref:DM13 domain-containing protein n=1 Tax=Micromonospora sp. WMMD882 TaxID=3015151 RepID=UPI00248B722E|nr:DM13 domain-containing protein [Micromonospora sp. WMMD882]WBB79276.1 DM13 domain-containing protein [Micromonospora sp. WMMD882]